MDSLRVDSGIKTIEVNDAGECISVNVSDASFFERYAALLKNFEDKGAEIERKGKELSDKHKDKTDGDVDVIIDTFNLYSELCKYVCTELDNLFGDGCCRKVFVGVENPSVELVGDFFEEITPLLQKYANERDEKINLRYNRNRKGSRSK